MHACRSRELTSQHSLQPSTSDVTLGITRRVEALTRIPAEHTEQIQVLRYLPNQHYAAHHDFFDPGDYAGSRGHGGGRKEQGLASNRMATVFFYLNDVPSGGETGFPRAGGLGQPRDFLDCHSRGLAVAPSKRKAVIFYSMLPSGDFDQFSLHAGCDVHNGTKWAANFWLWNTPQRSLLRELVGRVRGTS